MRRGRAAGGAGGDAWRGPGQTEDHRRSGDPHPVAGHGQPETHEGATGIEATLPHQSTLDFFFFFFFLLDGIFVLKVGKILSRAQ